MLRIANYKGGKRERKIEGAKGAQAVHKPERCSSCTHKKMRIQFMLFPGWTEREISSTHLFFVGEQCLELSLFDFNI